MAVDIRSLSSDTKTISSKQASLVSGTNIKTINGSSILGSGDLVVSGSGLSVDGTTLCNTSNVLSILPGCDTKWNNKQNALVSGTSIKTINGSNLLGSGDIVISGGGTTYTAGNAISLASDIISITAACDTKWSTDTNTTYSADGSTLNVTSNIFSVSSACNTSWSGKQSVLVSGTNIKTINGVTLLGSGDLIISGSGTTDGTTLCTTTSIFSILPACNTKWSGKQDSLVSGTSIKTINGSSILGSGNLVVTASGVAWGAVTGTIASQTDLVSCLSAKQNTLVSGTSIKTVNGNTLLGSGDIVISGGSSSETLGTAIASAATTTIGGSANSVHITGTTTITSFGTGTTGKTVKVIFDGALTLTHNATSLILSTGNIITAAGDSAVFLLENGASGYWRMLSYTRKTGMALIPPASVASATTATTATSSTTARCLTHAVTGYSANSLTCAITANCASIINTVITCGTGWYTAAICNIARGRCAWITNDIYDCSGGGTGYTCHSFGIKDATNANANVSCLIMSKDNLCFIKSDGTSSGNLINSLSGSNVYKALTISNFSFCCIGTAASCPASIKEILCTTLTDTTNLWSSLNCTFTFSCDGCYSLTNYVDYCTLSSNPNITILNCNNESGKTASLIICNTNRAAYAGANGGTISYTSNAVTSIVSHIYTKQSSMNTSCIDIWAIDQDSGGNNTTINTTYSCINIHSQSQCGYSEISMQSVSGNGAYLSPKISILSSSIFKGLKITGLPTSNPGVSGAVWNNNGVLNIVP